MENFIDRVFKNFTEEITDRIFLFIQEDTKGFLQEYLDLVSKTENGRQALNSSIGEKVNDYFTLKNIINQNGDTLKGNPKSFLIKTEFTKHEKK